VGPLTKKKMSTFWNDNRPLFFQVKLFRNLVTPGEIMEIGTVLDNKTNVSIDSIKVHLNLYNTTTTIALNGVKNTTTSLTKLHRIFFREESKFPMTTGKFKGRLQYLVCPDVDTTEADSSACFAREYELVVQCEIPYHQNVGLNFPIRIVK